MVVKRPKTGYMLWLNENRESIANEIGTKGVAFVAKRGSEKWKALGESAQEPWMQKARDLKAEFEQAVAQAKADRVEKFRRTREANLKRALEQGGAAAPPHKVARTSEGATASSSGPKRPLTAYFLWLGQNREAVAKEVSPKARKRQQAVAKLAATKWQALSEAERAPFLEKAQSLRAEYDKVIEESKKDTLPSGTVIKQPEAQKPAREPKPPVKKAEAPEARAQAPPKDAKAKAKAKGRPAPKGKAKARGA